MTSNHRTLILEKGLGDTNLHPPASAFYRRGDSGLRSHWPKVTHTQRGREAIQDSPPLSFPGREGGGGGR